MLRLFILGNPPRNATIVAREINYLRNLGVRSWENNILLSLAPNNFKIHRGAVFRNAAQAAAKAAAARVIQRHYKQRLYTPKNNGRTGLGAGYRSLKSKYSNKL